MNRRLTILTILCLLTGLLALTGGKTLSNRLTFFLLMRQDAPSTEAVFEILEASSDPAPRILSMWHSERIPHRHIALRFIKDHIRTQPGLYDRMRPLIRESAADVDFSNRELAWGILAEREPEPYRSLLFRLLRDRDQATRLRALNDIKDKEDPRWLPVLMYALDDPDPMVVTHAASKLRQWTGKDFGLRIQMAIPASKRASQQPNLPHRITQEQQASLDEGVRAWKAWWQDQPSQASFPDWSETSILPMEPLSLPLDDLVLTTMDGRTRRISDLKGKAVLLNFWTTWCASCMTEIPDLNWLNQTYAEELQIIGISLDGDDGHGHDHASIVDLEEAREKGWDAVETYDGGSNAEDHHSHDHAHASETTKPDLDTIRKKILRVIRKKSIEYPIAMDPSARIGQRFNGQELPTNVLIDAEGRIRRRFIGSRPIHSWESMLHEIGVSMPPSPQE